ncbi:MAG: hypothetical protein EOM37_08485 [Proteobacteria bacterium]|jgi:hypothetical protein|nr:hypothetical protein [Alphaproteobacteria bacterium]NCC04063.1 hypothetical protein [Pseudomonadota bacterium]
MAKKVNVDKSRFQTAAEKAAARKRKTHEQTLAQSKNGPQRTQPPLSANKESKAPQTVTITIRNASTDENGLIGPIVLKMTPRQLALYNQLNPQAPIRDKRDPKPRPRDSKLNPARRRAKRPDAAPV